MASLETTLISRLETNATSTSSPIFPLFSDYLRPFTDLTKSTKPPTQTQLRSLAKQFLPFLNRCLSLLPKRLSGNQKAEASQQLFEVYRLCLDCLELVSSQLLCKPYTVYYQRTSLLHCLEVLLLYREAVDEGFRVLERLRGIEFGEEEKKTKRKKKLSGKFLPVVSESGGDAEFARLVVEVVVVIVKCVALEQSREDREYTRVKLLVEELNPWFRVVDANAYEKLHRVLVAYLGKCTTFLVGELINFDGELVHSFCAMTLNEHVRSSLADQVYKFSRKICSSLFLLHNDGHFITDMLTCVVDFLVDKCKVDVENCGIKFLDIVSYCAIKCRSASTDSSNAFSGYLRDLASKLCLVNLPLDAIVRLYAVGLSLTNYAVMSEIRGVTSSEVMNDQLAVSNSILVPLLDSLECHFSCVKDVCQMCSSTSQACSSPISCSVPSLTHMDDNKRAYLLAYFNALKFLCQPLADMVNAEKYQIATKNESISVSSTVCSIQVAFHQLCNISLLFKSTLSEMMEGGFNENKLIHSVAVASFVLSTGLKLRLKKSVHLLKHIIDSVWIEHHDLKYLFANLYNIGVSLYKNKQMNEASKALILCCRASWACVTLLCQRPMDKRNESCADHSEVSIQNLIDEACKGTTFLLDVLHQCDGSKLQKIVLNTFESWSNAEDLFGRLPFPRPLVKQWVKIECKLRKTMDTEDCAPTLYSLLSSSGKLSKKKIGRILEQELIAYEEIDLVYSDYGQRMQTKIIDILLQEFYVMQDSYLQRSRIILKKALVLRALGSEVLCDCIQCVSEAISLMNGNSRLEIPICHQLAVAYSLRALYTHEAEPKSKQIFQDIKEAINLWLTISTEGYSIVNEETILSLDRALVLLYNIIDLISLKGSMELHGDICMLMIRWFKHMNIPLGKFMPMMWESRRFSHGLCTSPINDALVASLSGELGEECKFIDFWIQCLKGSPALLLGFQHSLSFLFGNFCCSSFELSADSQWNIALDDVKQAATELISNVPVCIPSISLVGYLYYDVCESLVASGKMYEALSYAKESHRLRLKLFQKKFMYSIDHQVEKTPDAEGHTEKTTYDIQNLRVRTSIASEIRSFGATSSNSMETCHLSSWKVLQCYLESTLQVGIIHEIIGNGVEAETILLWGKRIACAQGLSPFIVAFSSILGKLYCNKQSWDLAEKELQSAKQILVNNCSAFPCLKCRLMLEASVNQHLGDLYRSQISSCIVDGSAEKISMAESCYRSAIDKLNDAVWKHGVSGPAGVDVGNAECFCTVTKPIHTNLVSKMSRPNEKVETKRCRKTKSDMRSISSEQLFTSRTSRRVTRSKHCTIENQKMNILEEVQSGPLQHQKDSNESDISMSCTQNESVLDGRRTTVNLQCEFTRICSKTKCWSCIGRDIKKSGLLSNFIHIKWEFARRQVLLRVLSGIGNCLEANGQIHEAHESILQSMSVLVSQNPSSQTSCHIPVSSLLDFLGKEFPGDVFAIERAAIFYNICWFSFKSSTPEKSRNICCDLFHLPLSQVVPWLMLAFILVHEVPMLFQKVSRLLSSIFLLSSTVELFTLPSYSKKLSNSQWASYFHQASLGTHLNHHLYSNMAEKHKSNNLLTEQGSSDVGSMCLSVDARIFPRLAPVSVQDLEQFVINFFSKLPITTVICTSLMDGSYASLLRELLLYSGPVHAWMLLSRFNCISQPVMLLLPVQSVLEDSSDDEDSNSGSEACSANGNSGGHWHCPWGLTMINDVAPAFRFILEQNYLSSSTSYLEDTKISRTLWWNRRKKLDCRLHNLLRSLEDLWFGTWSIILLGEPSDGKNLDSVSKKLARNLKSKCKIDVNQSLLKILLGSAKNATECEISRLFSIKKACMNGCVIGEDAYQGEERSQKISKNSDLLDQQCVLAVQLFREAQSELEEDNPMIREPVILVLDFEVQMLPWESLPTLRNQEVYRMPSVASISLTLERNCRHQDLAKTVAATFPFIDPLDAFYLLNPSGDLTSTQVEFENWFRDKKLEGKAGSAPSAQELASALRSHDLFIYFGHGSGTQYISEQEVRKLENCGGSLLMGCSSGSLSLNGCYMPEGAPLSFLQAGSPIIVANLWEVTDKDIDRFGKAMLETWLEERSRAVESCSQCYQLAKEFEAMNIKGGKANAKRTAPKKKVVEDCNGKDHCGHVSRLGSFMGQAREACTLRYLIGASPVCYGVPTGIRRKKDL